MLRFLRLSVLVSSVLAVACEGGSSQPRADSADETDQAPACIAPDLAELPDLEDFEFVSDPCFLWNQGPDGEKLQIDFEVDAGVVLDTPTLLVIEHQLRGELGEAQLRLTAKYHSGEFTKDGGFGDKPVDDMTLEEVIEFTNDPVFHTFIDKRTGVSFDRINLGFGDNPQDLIFRAGTLIPVASVSDDSVTFCLEEVRGDHTGKAMP